MQYWFDHKGALCNSFLLFVLVPFSREFPEGSHGVSTGSTGTGHPATDPGTLFLSISELQYLPAPATFYAELPALVFS